MYTAHMVTLLLMGFIAIVSVGLPSITGDRSSASTLGRGSVSPLICISGASLGAVEPDCSTHLARVRARYMASSSSSSSSPSESRRPGPSQYKGLTSSTEMLSPIGVGWGVDFLITGGHYVHDKAVKLLKGGDKDSDSDSDSESESDSESGHTTKTAEQETPTPTTRAFRS